MRVRDIQTMALHALGKNKVQTALTMLGIVIGVSAVIAMVSLGQGAQKLVEQQVAGMGQNVLQVQGQAGAVGGGEGEGGRALGGGGQQRLERPAAGRHQRREVVGVSGAHADEQLAGEGLCRAESLRRFGGGRPNRLGSFWLDLRDPLNWAPADGGHPTRPCRSCRWPACRSRATDCRDS